MTVEARDGPYVAMAVICERVLEDKFGNLSAIQMLDRITVTGFPGAPADKMPSVPVKVTMLIGLRAGGAKGRRALKLQPETPAGTTLPELIMPVLFEGDERSANLIIDVPFTAELEGLYWFDVLLDERRLTRIPLRIVYRPVAHASRPPS
jgi:hypothetical protein